MPPSIDLNADLGEGFGRYQIGDDVELLSAVSSANIACGFHAGDPVIMRETVAAAAARGVAIGAHPGYPDLMGFGRRELGASPDEIRAYVVYQVGALRAVCAAQGTRLRYVKAHGAMYNRGAADPAVAAAIAAAVRAVDPALVMLGLAGSALIEPAVQAACERHWRRSPIARTQLTAHSYRDPSPGRCSAALTPRWSKGCASHAMVGFGRWTDATWRFGPTRSAYTATRRGPRTHPRSTSRVV